MDPINEGGWFCRQCQVFVPVLDAGEHNQRCGRCHGYHVEFMPPVSQSSVERDAAAGARRLLDLSEQEIAVVAGTRVRHTPEFLEKKKRLPAEERDLRVLARDGYHFCFSCLEVSKLDEYDQCVLCGSKEVRWQPGIEESIRNENSTDNGRGTGVPVDVPPVAAARPVRRVFDPAALRAAGLD